MIDISEIKFIKDLNMLRDLNLLRNPINELPDYRLLIIYRVPRLRTLDRKKVDFKEKVRNKQVISRLKLYKSLTTMKDNRACLKLCSQIIQSR